MASGGDPSVRSEHRNVTAVTPIGTCCTELSIDPPLSFSHFVWVADYSLPEAPRVPVDVEVAVTSRSIVVRTGRLSDSGAQLPAAFTRAAGNMGPRPSTTEDASSDVAPALANDWRTCLNFTEVCEHPDLQPLLLPPAQLVATATAVSGVSVAGVDTAGVNVSLVNTTALYCALVNVSYTSQPSTNWDHDPSFGARVRSVPTDRLSAGLAVAAALGLAADESASQLWPPSSTSAPAVADTAVAPLFDALDAAASASVQAVADSTGLYRLDGSLQPSVTLDSVAFQQCGQSLNWTVWEPEISRVNPTTLAVASQLDAAVQGVLLPSATTECFATVNEAVYSRLGIGTASQLLAQRHAALEVAVSVMQVDTGTTPQLPDSPPTPPPQAYRVSRCSFSESIHAAVHVSPTSLNNNAALLCNPRPVAWGDPQTVAAPSTSLQAMSVADRRQLELDQAPSPMLWCPYGRGWAALTATTFSPANSTAPLTSYVSSVEVLDNVVVGGSGDGVVAHVGLGATVARNLVTGLAASATHSGVPFTASAAADGRVDIGDASRCG